MSCCCGEWTGLWLCFGSATSLLQTEAEAGAAAKHAIGLTRSALALSSPATPVLCWETQDYLAHRCGHMAVPKVNNTNVDRSLDAIHATVFGRAPAFRSLYGHSFLCLLRRASPSSLLGPLSPVPPLCVSVTRQGTVALRPHSSFLRPLSPQTTAARSCLRRALAGQALWDAEARRTAAALEEFQRQQQSRGAWSSKSMLEVIKVRREMELAVTSDNPSTSSSAVGGARFLTCGWAAISDSFSPCPVPVVPALSFLISYCVRALGGAGNSEGPQEK